MSGNHESQKPDDVIKPLASGPDGTIAPEASKLENNGDSAPRVARTVSNVPQQASEPVFAPMGSEESHKSGRKSFGSKSGKAGVPRARRMSLSLTHLNVWSVAKVSFLLCVAGGIIQVVAAAILWMLLNVVGVFDQITQIVSSTGLDAGGFNLSDVFSLSTVLSGVTIFSIFEAVLLTVLFTIGALLYNVVSSLVGGVHVTLGDD
ncbi:hypothetical protein CRD60_03930 [Bifidobacterium aemilianum]|uniref:DUF3566 domain-containing protein n=1 Tax=Bifidobacterium aemilianum TaxID=2493120 RepID=A0A366K9F8_9BIFI|nr:DUF3566 domain-containing protein [Bifidobacterium aemilianum]RBP97763.1 hypothetical protein CRD60_03930 [Bifidobacterium aemilianum]